jgi:hypothetical protein
MRIPILVSGLILLLVANVMMMYYKPFGLIYGERFQNIDASGEVMEGFQNNPVKKKSKTTYTGVENHEYAGAGAKGVKWAKGAKGSKEGFESYSLATGGGAKDKYDPIGPFDGVKLSTGNSSSWRYTAPNEPLLGPAFAPGPDSLFMFKNNQCKPECCGASFSCDGGCVCTTPQQRDFINQRGGNRTLPEDGV